MRFPPAREENKTTPESGYSSGVQEANVPSRNGHARNVPPEDAEVKSHPVVVPHDLLRNPTITAVALQVYCVLSTYLNDKGWCYPSIKTLAAVTGHSEHTILKGIRVLEREGWLFVDRHKRIKAKTPVNIYYVFDHCKKCSRRIKDSYHERHRESEDYEPLQKMQSN